MKYIELVNNLLKQEVNKYEELVLFGQNISAGSCLGGLTRNLKVKESSKVINSTNSENSLCGFGFGLLIGGVNSILFMKQLDFLLLGIDHLVNTFNIIRNMDEIKSKASFTIMPIIVDNGYQGPQSSLNNLSDFCSIARIPGFTITNNLDAKRIISSELVKPGFRIICPSQRLFHEEIHEEKIDFVNNDNTIFQYRTGSNVTIVCFNLSFSYGAELSNRLKKEGISSSLFSVNSPISSDWGKIIEDLKITKQLVVFEDSKSVNTNVDTLLNHISKFCELNKKIVVKREINKDWLNPTSDIIEIKYNEIINKLS